MGPAYHKGGPHYWGGPWNHPRLQGNSSQPGRSLSWQSICSNSPLAPQIGHRRSWSLEGVFKLDEDGVVYIPRFFVFSLFFFGGGLTLNQFMGKQQSSKIWGPIWGSRCIYIHIYINGCVCFIMIVNVNYPGSVESNSPGMYHAKNEWQW